MRTLAFAAAAMCALAPLGAKAQSVQRISGVRIAALATRELSATVPHDADHDFVVASMVPDQIVADGRVELHAGAPIGTASFVNVPVRIDLDGRLDRTIFVGYRMQQYIETAVAAQDLVPGTVLGGDDVTMGRVPYRGQPSNGVDALIGRKINEAFTRGQAVTIADTAENQIVRAGSTVVFIVRDSGVQVSADAIARTGGGLGDQVFVYNPLTHKGLSGTVTGPGTVELDISGGDAP